MATHHDLLDAIARIRTATGRPDSWQQGLTGQEVAVALTPASSEADIDALLAKLRAAHPAVLGVGPPLGPVPEAPAPPSPRHGEGAAAEAIRHAETALGRQRSEAAHVDLQVVTAVLNAHATAAAGRARLDQLQGDIEAAVATSVGLDTPAGAREFQRYLVGKMREIRDVVESGSLDATSKASLAVALASLYSAATPEVEGGPAEPAEAAEDGPPESTGRLADVGVADLGALDTVDPLPPWDDLPVADPASAAAAPVPTVPAMPAAMAPGWGGGLPAGTPPSGPSGLSGSSGPLWPDAFPADLGVTDRRSEPIDDAGLPPEDRADPPVDAETADETGRPDVDPATTVVLPDGDSVVAPSPQIADAITAAVAGAPIPDAFGWQGITIPAPGTPVTAAVDPARLTPGDIGVFADRHALALGHGKALLDRQIQPISSVTGPGYIGWQHPPEPEPTTETPVIAAPERSAATTPS